MTRGWIGLAVALAALTLVGTARASTESLVSRQQALSIARPTWGQSAAGQYLAGQLAQHERDYASAADYLEGALSWDPNDMDLRRRVFLLMLAEGRLSDAQAHAYSLHREDPTEMLPIIAQAVVAMQAGEYDEALQQFGGLDSAGFAGLVRTLGQAWAAVGSGDLAAARAVIGFNDEQPLWTMMLKIHTALVEDVAGTDQAAEAYVAITDGTTTRSARAAELTRNFEARQNDATLSPLVSNATDGMAEAFFSIAAALNQGERALSSLIYAQLGLFLREDSDLLRLLIAEIMADQERYEAAAAVYAEINDGSATGYAAQLARARNLARADLPDQAIAVLRDLATAQPERAEASTLLGDVLRGEQRFDEAVIAYDEAAARLGKITAENWRLLYSRGIALEQSGQWARAESDLLMALSLQKDEAYVLNYLGYSWIDRGENLEKAEEMVRKAAELRPEDGFIADSLGWMFYRTGRYVEAVAELERAIMLEPVDPVINEHLGDAYWHVGRRNEARFQWQRALSLDPSEDLVPALKEKVRCGLERCAVARRAD